MAICKTSCFKTKNVFFFLLQFLAQTQTNTGRPFPIQNCTISNQTSDSFSIDCIEGFDGGLPQVFLLEVVEVPTLRLLRNLTLLVSIIITKKLVSFKWNV